MDEGTQEIYTQDGVMLVQGPASHMEHLGRDTPGILYFTKHDETENNTFYIEWKPNDNLTIESEYQDQEWAVVNAVERRSRTLSGTSIPDEATQSKCLRIKMSDIKSYKMSHHDRNMTFKDGRGETICSFSFQNGNSDCFVTVLKSFFKIAPTKRDKHMFVIIGEIGKDDEQLEKSFKTLKIYPDETKFLWSFVRNFQHRPYETTLEAFSKVTDIGNYFWNYFLLEYLIGKNRVTNVAWIPTFEPFLVYRSPDYRLFDDDTKEVLNKSIIAIENATTTQLQDGYEVIGKVLKLPERKECPRGKPFTREQWLSLQDYEGKIEDIESTKLVIFRGGIAPSLRKQVWKYLLNYYPWDSTQLERDQIDREKEEEYFKMKTQWCTMTKTQENNFSDYRERKSLIEKDVNRTDRTYTFYAGDNNPNIQLLHNILMTYVMFNFNLGYVQGMSDLLSPILCLMQDEVDAFWCFVGFMDKVYSNFDVDQAYMKEQLQQLHTLLMFVDPELSNYLDTHDSGNMFFCFRWLLVWFKRELNQEDVLKLWEVLWTGLPCQNFHLLISLAILETEKNIMMENNFGFTEILKHINELSCKLDINTLLNKAEGIYRQIEEAQHAPDVVRIILGLPILNNTNADSPNAHSFTYVDSCNDQASVNNEANEASFERAISHSYL